MKDKSPIALFLSVVVCGSFVASESRAASKPFHDTVASATALPAQSPAKRRSMRPVAAAATGRTTPIAWAALVAAAS